MSEQLLQPERTQFIGGGDPGHILPVKDHAGVVSSQPGRDDVLRQHSGQIVAHVFAVPIELLQRCRLLEDIERGWQAFTRSGRPVCFSVVRARKNPYFNMVERDSGGHVRLVKTLDKTYASRQSAPAVWDMNASIYFYKRDFLLSRPGSLWEGDPECFEMPPESAFDIDEERDFVITELMMKLRGLT